MGRKKSHTKVWNSHRLRILRALYPTMNTRELAKKLGVTYQACKSKATVLNLHKVNRKIWTKRDDALLRKHYPKKNTDYLQKLFKCTASSVYQRADKLGLKKDAAYLLRKNQRLGRKLANSEASKKSRFQKGLIPPNKGMKQTEYMSKEGIARTEATRFQKGGLPPTTLHDGAVTIRTDKYRDGKTQRQYKWIRIDKAKWVMYHVHIWTKKHGPVPLGKIVIFKDGNSMNCKLSNLKLISLEDNMRRNTIHRYPAELKSLIRLQGKLKRIINEKQNRRSA